MKVVVTVIAASLLMLSGCSTTGRCKGVQEYQKAQTMPTPPAVPDLKVQDSASSLKIPPPPAKAVAYGEQVPDPAKAGKTKLECLDTPPAMSEPTPVPAAAPAAAPAPASKKP